MATIRFVVLALLAILLLNPLINQFFSQIEQPVYVIAFDNSKSLENTLDSDQIREIKFGIFLCQCRSHLEQENRNQQDEFPHNRSGKIDTADFPSYYHSDNGAYGANHYSCHHTAELYTNPPAQVTEHR